MKEPEQVYGIHAVTALLATRPAAVTSLAVVGGGDERRAALLAQAQAAGIAVERVSRKALDQRLPGINHQGVLATVQGGGVQLDEQALPAFLAALAEPAFLLVLDGVQDPHNLGACLRGAAAAGAHAVIAPADRAAGLNATVRKVACGAAEIVPFIAVTNLARTLRELRQQGLWIVGAAGEADASLYEVDFTLPTAIVLGAEEKGLRRLTREVCDRLARIPMAGNGVESLNVSVAAGIFLFEARRQRGVNG